MYGIWFILGVLSSVLSSNESLNVNISKTYPNFKSFGQLSAVSVDGAGDVYVFHRGDRIWDQFSFDEKTNKYARKDGPIQQHTILVLSGSKGDLLHSAGDGVFYMPHGLTVDHEDNLWITDVGLHQVFKFPPLKGALGKPIIVLGEALIPGRDDAHFCKPTSVSVDRVTGDFFVSDGYCNSRVIKYNKMGKKLIQWGRHSVELTQYSLFVPHSLALDREQKTIYVADRENKRVMAYNSSTGAYLDIYGRNDAARIYAVTVNDNWDDLIFTLGMGNFGGTGVVNVYNKRNRTLVSQISPPGHFSQPHDLAICPDGTALYVVELTPYRLWKFHLGKGEGQMKALPSETVQEMKKEIHSGEALDATKLKFGEEGSRESSLSKFPHEDAAEEKTLIAGLGSTELATALVSMLILFSLAIIMYHVYKRKSGYRRSEIKGLILTEDYEMDE